MLKEVAYNEYLIRELSIGQFLPIIGEADQVNFQKTQLALLELSVCDPVTKQPIGKEGLDQIGASSFKPIWDIVAEMHGLVEKKQRIGHYEYLIYQLAENLSCSVTYLKTLPVAELKGWFAFYEEKTRREKAGKGDLMSMDEDDMVENLRAIGVVE